MKRRRKASPDLEREHRIKVYAYQIAAGRRPQSLTPACHEEGRSVEEYWKQEMVEAEVLAAKMKTKEKADG